MSNNSQKNYKKILDTAIPLFRQHGFDQVSISEICQKSGVSRGTFYNIFKSKENLIASFFTEAIVLHENYVPEILSAENDLERLWIIHGIFINMATDVGWSFIKQIFIISLEPGQNTFDDTIGAEDWFAPLIQRCQALDIIKNPLDANLQYNFMIHYCLGITYKWCSNEGDFSLRKVIFEMLEDFYIIAPENRGIWKNMTTTNSKN